MLWDFLQPRSRRWRHAAAKRRCAGSTTRTAPTGSSKGHANPGAVDSTMQSKPRLGRWVNEADRGATFMENLLASVDAGHGFAEVACAATAPGSSGYHVPAFGTYKTGHWSCASGLPLGTRQMVLPQRLAVLS